MGDLEGADHHAHSTQGSDSSIGSSIPTSRRSSTSSSLIAQLLSPSPPANIPVQSPQSQGIPTSCSSMYSQSPPVHQDSSTGRRFSYQADTNPPHHITAHNRSKRNTLPELYPSPHPHHHHHHHHILDQRLAGHAHLPSFPVNIHQGRDSSPTKMFSGSPTGTPSVGRRSPIHEIQMDSIAEDSTEDTGVLNTSEVRRAAKLSTPSLTGNFLSSVGRRRSLPTTMSSTTSDTTAPDDQRQRKSGLTSILQTPVTPSLNVGTTTAVPGGLNPSSNQQLLNVLQAPLFQHPHDGLIQLQSTTNAHTEFYTNSLNHYNRDVPQVALPQNFLPHPSPQEVLRQVSSILNAYGICYHHSNGTFAVEHQGVKLRILVGNLAAQSAIQLQYVAGDTTKYQTLCTQLSSHLAMQLAQ